MAIDPYSLCPCGSGKKVKFCCNDIVEDMSKILSMRQNNQLHMALQSLSRLRSTLKPGHPGEVWVRTTEATILLEDNQVDLAKKAVAEAVEAIPNNPQLIALSALTSVLADGYEASKKVVNEALQSAAGEQRQLVSNLSLLLAQHFMESNKIMAARRHLTLALRHSVDPTPLIEQLSSFDSNQSLPYWFRSDFFLKTVDVDEKLQEDYNNAVQLEERGCFQLAADAFEAIANKDPENSGLWYNTGLCLAWAGDNAGAIEALGEAACTEDDFDEAVRCETLCQMLELMDPEEGVSVTRTAFDVKSVSKLLTNWQDTPRLVRETIDEQQSIPNLAGVFRILDRPALSVQELEQGSIDDVANIIGDLTVLDAPADSEASPIVLFEYHGKEPLEDQINLLVESAAGEIEINGESQEVSILPSEIHELHFNWHIPVGTPLHVGHRLQKERWEKVIDDVWPNLPLAGLDGKTPLEAVDDEESRLSLAAAVNTLEALCDQREFFFDPQPLRDRLKVPAPQPIPVTAETSLSGLSLDQLGRLNLAELTDEQLIHVMRRAVVTQISSLCYDVFLEILSRNDLVSPDEINDIHSGMVALARNRFNREQALKWIEKGRAFDRGRNQPLEEMISWDLREATVRLWDPSDPAGPQLLKKLWEETGVKLPFLRPVLERLVETAGIDAPWDGSIIQTAGEAAASTGGVWTPGGEQPAEEKSKLWIPGQD